jgi:hypothetical protein
MVEHRSRLSFVGLSTSVALLLAFIVVGFTGTDTRATPRAEVLSDDAGESALAQAAGDLGPIDSIYGSAVSTIGSWLAEEPHRAYWLESMGHSTEDPIYVFFVMGHFEVAGPYSRTEGRIVVTFSAARIIADETGTVLNEHMWIDPPPSTPMFSSDFG